MPDWLRIRRMTSVLRTFAIGLAATVLGVVVWLLTSAIQVDAPGGVLGVAAGLVAGLIDDRSPVARFGALLVGLVLGLLALALGMVGWVGFVVAAIIFTIISGLTGGRLPLWAIFLGSGALAAAYGPELIATPWFVLTEFPSTFLVVLASSAGGFIIAVIAEALREPAGPQDTAPGAGPEFDESGAIMVQGSAT